MKILVTGVTGRLGSFVIDELRRGGHELVLFSRRQPPVDDCEWVQGDINSPEDCMKAASTGVDAVCHLAAQPWPTDHPREFFQKRVREQSLPFDTTMKTNIMGTYYMLYSAWKNGIGLFVMTGSNCALGHGFRISDKEFPLKYLPVDESHPSDVEDSYSFSKLVCEQLLDSYTRSHGIRTYAIRSAGIWSPQQRRDWRNSVGPSEGWNQWLWAWVGSEDVASAHRLVLEKADELPPHDVFFCNADDTIALEPTMELIEKFKPEYLSLVKRPLEGHSSLISNRKLKEMTGWRHVTSWRKEEEEVS